MNTLKICLLALLLQPLSCLAYDVENVYLGAIAGVGNVEAVGLYAAEPRFTTVISPIKNTAYPFLYGVALGYDWCGFDAPFTTEFMYLNMDQQRFQMSNLYPLN